VPWIRDRSIPASLAIRRATGEALTRASGGGGASSFSAFSAGGGASGAAGAGLAGSSAIRSPGSAMMPITVPTGTVRSGGTTILARTPEAGASISTVAFSVSISATAWPFSIRSPSCFSQRTSFPSVMSNPKEGRMTLVATGTSLDGAIREALVKGP
jgi:hypothetical protein